jgi:hypothetical protein
MGTKAVDAAYSELIRATGAISEAHDLLRASMYRVGDDAVMLYSREVAKNARLLALAAEDERESAAMEGNLH